MVQQLRVAVPFVFSHLTRFAMPVRRMLSGVVVDGSSQVDAAAAATGAVARESSAVGDEPGLLSYDKPWYSKGEQWLSQAIALEDIGSRYFDKKEKVPKELLGPVCIAGKWFFEY